MVLLPQRTAIGDGVDFRARYRDEDRSAAIERCRAPAQLSPGEIDLRVSRVYILVGKTGLGHEHGIEGRIKSGVLSLGATANAGQIVFDTTTFRLIRPPPGNTWGSRERLTPTRSGK